MLLEPLPVSACLLPVAPSLVDWFVDLFKELIANTKIPFLTSNSLAFFRVYEISHFIEMSVSLNHVQLVYSRKQIDIFKTISPSSVYFDFRINGFEDEFTVNLK